MNGAHYELQAFEDQFDEWVEREQPSATQRLVTLEWVIGRSVTPFLGAQRARGFDNLWYAAVPRSLEQGRLVLCSSWIYQRDATVRCDNFALLSPPV